MKVIPKDKQGYGAFNNGEIVENKPIGFPQDGGEGKAISNVFYWANAIALEESTIGLHPHQGFEIMSFVIEGSIRHYDTRLKQWIDLHQGDAQIIRAGNGISHAEHMTKGSRMFQIWVDPDLNKTLQKAASYSDYKYADIPVTIQSENKVRQYIGQESPFTLDTEHLTIEEIEINSEFECTITENEVCMIYVLEGTFVSGATKIAKDDYIIIDEIETTQFHGNGKFFVIRSKKALPYLTYAQRMRQQMRRQ